VLGHDAILDYQQPPVFVVGYDLRNLVTTNGKFLTLFDTNQLLSGSF
jgi:hypothetical protein